jgi:hypothetical protein
MTRSGKSVCSAFRNGLRRPLLAGVPTAALAGAMAAGLTSAKPASTKMPAPRYDAEGALLRPRDFYTWVFVGASLGLNYSADGHESGPGTFHNVYTQQEAYRQYLATGSFPEKTMLVMPIYKPAQKVSINHQGYFEGDLADLDVSVKDQEHFPEGWAYFNFTGAGGKLLDKAKAFPKTMCYSCHREHGAHDNVFTQCYPVLRETKNSR